MWRANKTWQSKPAEGGGGTGFGEVFHAVKPFSEHPIASVLSHCISEMDLQEDLCSVHSLNQSQ